MLEIVRSTNSRHVDYSLKKGNVMYSLVKKKTYHARASGWRLEAKPSWILRDVSLQPDTSKYQVIKDFKDWDDVVKYFCLAFKRDTYTLGFEAKDYTLWAIVSNKLSSCEKLKFDQIQIVPSKSDLTPTTKHISFRLTEENFRSLVSGNEIVNPAFEAKITFRSKLRQISEILFGKKETSTVQAIDSIAQEARKIEEPSQVRIENTENLETHSKTQGIAVFSPQTNLGALTKPRLFVNTLEQKSAPEFSQPTANETTSVKDESIYQPTSSEEHSIPLLSAPFQTPNIVNTRGQKIPAKSKKLNRINFKKVGLFAASLMALIGLGLVGDQGLKNLESRTQKDTTNIPVTPTQIPVISPNSAESASVALTNESKANITEQVIVQENSVCKDLTTFPNSSDYSDQQWFRLDASKYFSCKAQDQNFKDPRLSQLIKFQDAWLNPSLLTEKLLLEAVPSNL